MSDSIESETVPKSASGNMQPLNVTPRGQRRSHQRHRRRHGRHSDDEYSSSQSPSQRRRHGDTGMSPGETEPWSSTVNFAALFNLSVQEADGNFFENFAALQWKLENAKLQRLREDDLHQKSGAGAMEDVRRSPKETIARRISLKIGQLTRLAKREMDGLYVEVLYTIRHKIGATTGSHTPFVEDLYIYAQDAFHVNSDEHAKLIAKANEEKPPRTLFNVIVIEARDVLAKDANGFSDPYCMLGVMPGDRKSNVGSLGSPPSPTHGASNAGSLTARQLDPNQFENDSDSDRTDEPRKRGGSFRKKLGCGSGGSFRRKNKGAIPARIIKATSVQRCTLNPKWNEKFQLDFDDPESDQFHLDIWDHDDEGASVVEAVKKLNEVASLKGLGRYFKQVAQSARCDAEESADDFLGCVTIPISDVPSTGLQQWYELRGRSAKSAVRGSIHLKMWVSTREDRNLNSDDNLVDIKEHQSLIKIFTEHELRQLGGDLSKWSGQFPQAAQTILHQHAIQGDITDVQQSMCMWLAYSKMHLESPFEYSFLYKVLDHLVTLWVPTALSKDEEDMLSESFSEFLSHCYEQTLRHRESFTSKDKQACLRRTEDMMRCLRLLHSSAVFKKCLPFQRDLGSELQYIFKKSAIRFFEKAKHNVQSENSTRQEPFSALTHLLTALNAGCYRAYRSFHKAYERSAGINYFYITYREWDRLLQDDLCSIMAETKSRGALVFETGKAKPPEAEDSNALLPIFELYLSLAEFHSYRQYLTDDEKAKLNAVDFGRWFESAVTRWLTLVRDKSIQRVDCACHMDRKPPANVAQSEIKESSSHADVCRCIMQIVDFWVYLDYPTGKKTADLLERLVQDLCKCGEYYSDKIFAQLAQAGFYDDTLTLSDTMVDQMCGVVNNAEHVNEIIIELPRKLRLKDFVKKLSVGTVDEKDAKKLSISIHETVIECSKSISDQITIALNRLVDRQKSSLVKHVFHLVWSPEGCAMQKAIKPLIDQLEVVLSDHYHKWLLQKNFHRLLLAEMRSILQEIKSTLAENPGREPAFYKRLLEAIAYLSGYFHADGRGVSKEEMSKDSTYKEVTTLLQLNQLSTQQLILQYYSSLGKQQEEQIDGKYGVINVRAYYNSHSSVLIVEVLNARNILALDSNGLSDPFVILELVPTMAFQNCRVVKTRIVNKTLNPVFNETFEFAITHRLPQQAWLHFVVMDHDFLMTNDYAGEAFLSVSDVPGATHAPVEKTSSSASISGGGGHFQKQFTLSLMHPDHANEPSVTVLGTRKEDREAQEFLRHIEAIRRS